MASNLPRLFLARHGDTDWTDARRKTGRTDLPLNACGERRARELGGDLRRFSFTRVFTSPLQRARRTCELSGFIAGAVVDADLAEWDYGRFEGKLSSDVQSEQPGWELFRDGCPGGETPADVAARADRFVEKVRSQGADVLAFSSGHIIRMIAARWLGLPPSDGRFFFCRPTSVGVLSFEHSRLDEPIVALWNYISGTAERPIHVHDHLSDEGTGTPDDGAVGGGPRACAS